MTTPSKDTPMGGITVPEGSEPVSVGDIEAALNALDPDVAIGGENE